MAVPIFSGRHIAVIWDFDGTLIPGNQQEPLFEEYGVQAATFWKENNALPEHYKARDIVVSPDTIYLNHVLTYVKEGKMAGLTNRKLKELGERIRFYEGMPEFMGRVTERIQHDLKYQALDISVEHYVVSTGLRQMILGSGVAPYIKGVWASEFIEEPAPGGYLEGAAAAPGNEDAVITQVGYFLDHTTKTRAIWEINKGTNVDPNIGVNDLIAVEERRVPIPHMLYVADGPSDIPVFSILNQYGGKTLGVYNPSSDDHFKNVKQLQDEGRVQHFSPADYRENSDAYRWIMLSVTQIADEIVKSRELAVQQRVQPAVGHVL